MKKSYLFLYLALITFMMGKTQAQLNEYIIQPATTDATIDGHDADHYAYFNSEANSLGKLLLFTPGTNATGWDYRMFLQTAADLGYHAVGLSYENLESLNIEICPGTQDPTCHGRARREIWLGEDLHDSVDVDVPNSILNRFTKLLIYLSEEYPDDNWNQFLTPSNYIVWENVVTAGHSQGAGHAMLGGKMFLLDRVIMLSWVDWMWPGTNPAWITSEGLTPASSLFGFIHTGDASIYNGIPTTWENLGLNEFGDVVSVDSSTPPYGNTHSLITSAPIDAEPTQTNYHNATAVDWMTPINPDTGESIYKPVWEYLLGKESEPSPGGALRISPEGMSYIDPEIHDDAHKLAYQTGGGAVWLADLEPVTGTFVSGHGADLLLAQGAAPLVLSFNGPEFGVDQNGWSVFYCKENGGAPQVWRADINGTQVTNTPLTSGTTNRLSQLATKSPLSPSIRLVYSKGPTLDEGEIAWIDEDQPGAETIIDSLDEGCRWVDDTRSFIYIKQTGPNKGEVAIYNTDEAEETILTNDGENKSYPYGWFAPEYNNELVFLSIVNDSLLGIYRESEGGFYERILTIGPPPEALPYRYIGSPEPFVAGGKSYISYVLKQTFTFSSYVDTQVWVSGIEPDAEHRTLIQCDDGTDAKRTDPESYIGANEVFIIYNLLTDGGVFEVWRFATGIPVQPVGVDPAPVNKKAELLLYPNPASQTINLELNDSDSPFQVALLNMAGQVIGKFSNQTRIPLHQLQPGVYFIRVTQQHEIFTGHFLKQ